MITRVLEPKDPSYFQQLISMAMRKLKNNSYVKMEIDNERKLIFLSSEFKSQLKKIEEEIWEEIEFIPIFNIIEKENK